MNPLEELKGLIAARSRTTTATVVSSTETQVSVATRAGVVQLANNGSLYTPGDTLLVRNSVVLGRVKKDKDIPEYFL